MRSDFQRSEFFVNPLYGPKLYAIDKFEEEKIYLKKFGAPKMIFLLKKIYFYNHLYAINKVKARKIMK